VRDTWSVRIVERDVPLPERFKALSGFRIAQISDVQGDGRTTPETLRNYVSRVNSLKPDLVLFAGDLVTSGTLYIDSTAEILGGLKARHGSIAAIGDHDIFSRKSMVLEALARAGVTVVEDSTLTIKADSARIAVTVVTYTYSQKPTNGRLDDLMSVGENNKYRILLVHQPAEALVDLAAKRGYQLFIAGHTHGGGISFGIPGLFLVAPAHTETRYVSGFYVVNNLLVSVTNGLGFTLAPVRYHAPAEIVMLTLR
jgi:predicted MPP superfamily phosphohydrolase